MADEPTSTPVEPDTEAGQHGRNYTLVAKWAALTVLSSAILALELLGFEAKGTFITLVGAPGLAVLGLHYAAKSLS